MDRNCKLSNVTQAYLNAYYTILNTMIRRMTRVPLSCSISETFIQQMIPHHLAAIEMSRNILRYTTNLEIQRIATNIISAQTKSISNMQAIQCKCRMLTNTDFERSQYMKRFEKIAQTMFAEMGSAAVTNGVNANFVREMIPHHEGAVRMSNNVLQFNICPELKPILYAIITTQCEGIKQLKNLLNQLDHC
jgi:uncharacterized protein (DUF305 family)